MTATSKTKTKTKTKTAARPIEIEIGVPQRAALGALAPVVTGSLTHLTASTKREALLNAIDKFAEQELTDIGTKVNERLEGDPVIANVLAVHDYFDNAPGSACVHLHDTTNARSSLADVVDELGDQFKTMEIGLLEDLDPEPAGDGLSAIQPVDAVGQVIAEAGEGGVFAHVIATVRPRPYSELLQFHMAHPMLGSQPGRDGVQILVGQVCNRAVDPDMVTVHSPVGAALGRRMTLDSKVHIAEPMAAKRDHQGIGAMGLLDGLDVVPPPDPETQRPGKRHLTEKNRNKLASLGLNCLRDWPGVGGAVIMANRSLLEGGERPYQFVSTVRLRHYVQAIFHETAEHEIRDCGQREAGPLIKTAATMNAFLKRLQQEKWIESGRVVVDHEDLVVRLKVDFKPVRPVDRITIEFWEH